MTEGIPLILNDTTNNYIYGPGGRPVEQINNTTGVVTYLHHDQQGSTRLFTGSTGTVTGSTTFDAYGNKTGSTGTTTTPLGYDAQYTSTDTGLIYLRARAYDPATVQFLTVDPAAATTRALYNYAGENPINAADPSGLDTHGYCAGASGTAGPMAGFGSVYLVKSDTSEIGIELTGGASGGLTTNTIQGLVAAIERNPMGLLKLFSYTATGAYQSSNASNVCELGGPFSYTQGTVGYGLSVGYESFSKRGWRVRADIQRW